MRSTHSHNTSAKDNLYYRCAALQRDESCDAAPLHVPEASLAPQLEPYLAVLHPPDGWQDAVRRQLTADEQRRNLVRRRDQLRAQLRRLNDQYEHGLIEEAGAAAYRKKAQALIREINAIGAADVGHVIDKCEQALVAVAAWPAAGHERRHAILKELFEAVYVDTDAQQIVGVAPHAELEPLFGQTRLVVREGRYVL
jgi:hypothetical protein